jgi:Ser-tRNA(Ala) deacylase AlaX
MRKLFWDNPYQSSLNTRVSSIDGNHILFDETIAFSFSGGQESDRAYVNGLPIIHSEIVGSIIYYILPENHGIFVGDKVIMEIDWIRRYRLMRLHFAAELILELVTKKLGIKKIGAHIAEKKARIDFSCNTTISVIFEDLLVDFNEIIKKDQLINTGYSDVENQRRYWEIEGFSKVPCGGTHVKSTAEVGYIALKRINVGGGKERIQITLLNY